MCFELAKAAWPPHNTNDCNLILPCMHVTHKFKFLHAICSGGSMYRKVRNEIFIATRGGVLCRADDINTTKTRRSNITVKKRLGRSPRPRVHRPLLRAILRSHAQTMIINAPPLRPPPPPPPPPQKNSGSAPDLGLYVSRTRA